MTNETIKVIKGAIKALANDLGLSDYKRRQIQKGELESPEAWGTYPEGDNSEDACIQRYYSAIDAIYSNRVSAAFYTNIYIDFRDRLLFHYGVHG